LSAKGVVVVKGAANRKVRRYIDAGIAGRKYVFGWWKVPEVVERARCFNIIDI